MSDDEHSTDKTSLGQSSVGKPSPKQEAAIKRGNRKRSFDSDQNQVKSLVTTEGNIPSRKKQKLETRAVVRSTHRETVQFRRSARIAAQKVPSTSRPKIRPRR